MPWVPISTGGMSGESTTHGKFTEKAGYRPVDNFSSFRDDLPYARWVRWERFFDDLEDQLASEWEAERAALDTEAERLRLSRVALRERLAMLVERERDSAPPSFEVADGTVLSAEVTGVGADWVALDGGRHAAAWSCRSPRSGRIGMPHADLLRSARPAPARSALAERMTLRVRPARPGSPSGRGDGAPESRSNARGNDRSRGRGSPRPRAARTGNAATGRRGDRTPHRAVRRRRLDPARSRRDAGRSRRTAFQSAFRTIPVPHSSGKLASLD